MKKLFTCFTCLLLCSIKADEFNEWSLGIGHGQQKTGQDNSMVWSQWVFNRKVMNDVFDWYAGTSFAALYTDFATNQHTETFSLVGGVTAHLSKSLSIDVSVGPSFLTQRVLGDREQGTHFSFQNIIKLNYQIADATYIGLGFIHYSNGSIASPNQSFDVRPFLGVTFTTDIFFS
ncbi:MAG: acyloxyacyl hydrolase [Candidatus Comchoanobacterales bacterium]